jgi:hypothetical protein
MSVLPTRRSFSSAAATLLLGGAVLVLKLRGGAPEAAA